MIPAQLPQWPRQVVYGAAFGAFLALSACGGGGSDSSSSASTPAAGGTAGTGATGTTGGSSGTGTTGSTGTTSPANALDTALVRKWNINAGEWFGARLPTVPTSCDGPLVMDLTAAGTFTWSGTYTCYSPTTGIAQFNGRFTSSGTYTANAGSISMTITVDSAETQFIGGPWVSAPSTLNNQTGTYALSGQRLTLTFPLPAGSGSATWSVILDGS